jgi:predicted GNAT family acetyltransferase
VAESTSTERVNHNEAESRFEVDLDGKLAVTQYTRRGSHIFYNHTEVPPEMEGQGIGNSLAKAALDYAEAEGLKVVPRCRFIASYIERNPQYQHLVDEQLNEV